jgi:hypothetical protein
MMIAIKMMRVIPKRTGAVKVEIDILKKIEACDFRDNTSLVIPATTNECHQALKALAERSWTSCITLVNQIHHVVFPASGDCIFSSRTF